MGKMSRDKGKRGEREVAALIRSHGFTAKRGQQHRGGVDSPDIIHNIPNVTLEVKFREQFSLYAALEKLGYETPLNRWLAVFHRRLRKPWIVFMDADDFLSIMEELARCRELVDKGRTKV